MHFDLRPFLALWILLAGSVIFFIAWRKVISNKEDDSLHVLHGAPVNQQMAVASKLEMIDKWGKILTVIAVIVGLLVGAAYVYQNFMQASSIPSGA